jgi:FMN phosphatase YigB (HAD superfamily)
VDIIGAKNAGMMTVFLGKETDNSEKADIRIGHLNELPSAIKQCP